MGLSASLLIFVGLLPGQVATDLYEDFRGARLPAIFTLGGPEAVASIKPEAEGLRITLPADRKVRQPVGVVLDATVQGDFEITAGYEILQSDSPAGTASFGVGFELYIMTRTPTQEAVAFSRLTRVEEGESYLSSRMTTIDGKRKHGGHHTEPSPSKAGRLRVKRTAKEVVLSVADGAAGEFREFKRYELGPEEVKMLRLAALTGNAPIGVDLRVLDLKVHADNVLIHGAAPTPIPGADAKPAPSQPTDPAQTGPAQGGARVFVLLLLGVAALGVGLFVWHMLQRKQTETKPAATKTRKTGFAADDGLDVQCPHCEKHLKLPAHAVDKKVKCPGCTAVFVASVRNS